MCHYSDAKPQWRNNVSEICLENKVFLNLLTVNIVMVGISRIASDPIVTEKMSQIQATNHKDKDILFTIYMITDQKIIKTNLRPNKTKSLFGKPLHTI